MDLYAQTVSNQEAWNLISSDPRKALKLCQDCVGTARSRGDQAGLVDALVNTGWAELSLAANGEALGLFNEALSLAREHRDFNGELRALDGLGTVYRRFSRYQTALELFLQALRLARDSQNRDKEIVATNALGEIYLDIGQPQQALEYFEQAQALTDKHTPRDLRASILANLGEVCLDLDRSQDSLEHLSHGLVLYKESANKTGEARTLTQIGQIYERIGELGIAEEYHQESLKICLRLGHKWGQLEAYLNLADLAFKRNLDPEKIQWFYEKVVALGADADSKLYSSKGYAGLTAFYQAHGEFEKALNCYRQQVQMEKLLSHESLTQKITYINTQFEYEKSQAESEILRLRAEALERQSVELRQSFMTVSIISEIGKKITSALGLNQLLKGIYENVRELMDATIFGVALVRDHGQILQYRMVVVENQARPGFALPVAEGQNLASWCIHNRQSLRLADVPAEGEKYLHSPPKPDFELPRQPQSAVYLPLVLESRIIGLLTVQSYSPQVYTAEHQAILEALGGYMAIALANSVNHRRARRLNRELALEKAELEKATEKIRHMAHHDNLTGLPNRRLLSEFLIRTLSFSHRNHSQFAVLYLDLDGFKPVNDSLGHESGDAVLVEVSRRLTSALRESDLVARVGGDEFVAVAHEVEGRAGAESVAVRILEKLTAPIRLKDREFFLGASIGIAVFPDHGTDPELLVHAADAAMYKVKKSGKNALGFAKTAADSGAGDPGQGPSAPKGRNRKKGASAKTAGGSRGKKSSPS